MGERAEPGVRITVRDHARPCEHGSLWAHWISPSTARWWKEPDCPGGREMILQSQGDGVWAEAPGSDPPSG